MATRNRIGVWLYLILGVFATLPLYADGSLFGTIAGKIKDESEGAVPGATVELESQEKGFKRTGTSDAAGAFTFALLPPGSYTVTVKPFELRDADPARDQPARPGVGIVEVYEIRP